MKLLLKVFSSKILKNEKKLYINYLSAVFVFVMTLMSISFVSANECVQCPSASASEFVCGVNEQGAFKKFGSECLLRFENCEQKTSEFYVLQIIFSSLTRSI